MNTAIESLVNTAAAALCRGRVVEVRDDEILVRMPDVEPDTLACERLHTGAGDLGLVAGDHVLVWLPPRGSRGIVLGRIGGSHASLPAATPDEITLEAKHTLTLRVGEGSITIREDGKILIKGKDLVSHAQRMNRIKGGAVSIN